MRKTPELSHPPSRLSTKRVKVVHDLYWVYIENDEQWYGQGLTPLEAWRDFLDQTYDTLYRVPSDSGERDYPVDLNDPDFPKCGCPYFFHRCLDPEGNYIAGMICKHIERKAKELLQRK